MISPFTVSKIHVTDVLLGPNKQKTNIFVVRLRVSCASLPVE